MLKKCSIYIHYPYCTRYPIINTSKCTYCNFNKYILPKTSQDLRMTLCYNTELKHDLQTNYTISSIYFGGGTPSLASVYSY